MPKKSLILVEDLDLIFEEDDGFISATCQLASKTKRPIVMTARDTCSHLSRMAPQQLRIYYQRSIGSRVSAMLELITLGESGCRLPRPCLNVTTIFFIHEVLTPNTIYQRLIFTFFHYRSYCKPEICVKLFFSYNTFCCRENQTLPQYQRIFISHFGKTCATVSTNPRSKRPRNPRRNLQTSSKLTHVHRKL